MQGEENARNAGIRRRTVNCVISLNLLTGFAQLRGQCNEQVSNNFGQAQFALLTHDASVTQSALQQNMLLHCCTASTILVKHRCPKLLLT